MKILNLEMICLDVIRKNKLECSRLPKFLQYKVKYIQQCCIREDVKTAIDYQHLHCLPENLNSKMMEYAISRRLYSCIDFFISKGLKLPLNSSLQAVKNDDLELIQYISLNGKLHPATLFEAALGGLTEIVKYCSNYLPITIEILEVAELFGDVELIDLCLSKGVYSHRLFYNSI
jgi:hypothetical protein